MTQAYLTANGLELRSVVAATTPTGGTTEIPDHRSKEVANENARNIGSLMGQLSGLAGTGKVRG